MGIRFFCPQGHKLNVKSFLAGKIGFCPYCNVKVEIPLTSTRESSKKKKGAGAAQNASMSRSEHDIPLTRPASAVAEPVAQPDNQAASAVPVAQPATAPAAQQAAQAGSQQAVPQGGSPQAVPQGSPQTGSAAAQQAMPAGQMAQPQNQTNNTTNNTANTAQASDQPLNAEVLVDPIAESPNSVWYVRPVTGGQYGPATGEAMRQWLDEGRVAADSLVWREGWPDWRTAATTFPKFATYAGPIQVPRG